ncbi:AraC family transcriptional regulator [Chitinophaga sp.]|uniref:AraC family transcriptional regulator n=1 Tax=Chitinophaga sp. TaxID=1869181 RepID=UPI0031DDC33C
MKNTWSILQGKNFQFLPLPPEARYPQLLNETTAARASNETGNILAQHFYDHYARAWLYDMQLQQETTLHVALPQTAAMMVYVLQGEVTLKTRPFHTTRLFENSYSFFSLQPQQHTLDATGHCRVLFLQLTAPLRSLLDESHINIPLQDHQPGQITEECRKLLRSLHQHHYSGEIWQLKRQVIILDLLFKTLDEIGVSYKKQQASTYHRDYDTLKQVKDYVQRNIHKKLSVQTLATRFSIEPSFLRRGYKKVFHRHLCDYIREVRLAHARNLLQNTTLSVHEIAWEVGYESSTSFTRVFTMHFQQSPSDFRKTIIKIV